MNRPVRSAALLTSLSLALAGCATPGRAPDRFVAGRDLDNNRCTATANPARAATMFDQAFVLTCEGATAARTIGSVTTVPERKAKPEPAAACAAPAKMDVAGIGEAELRRCYDAEVAAPVVVVRYVRHGTLYRGSATADATAPLIHTMAAIQSGRQPTSAQIEQPSGIKLDQLAQAPTVGPGPAGGATFDPVIALRNGGALNRQGLYPEASQGLNDALSRMPASTAKDIQIELLLEAGLADSNIQFSAAAADHFARADALLKGYSGGNRAALLERKRFTYGLINDLDARRWDAVIAALSQQQAAFPLQDVSTLSELNTRAEDDASSAVGGASEEQLTQIYLDALRAWAASIAQLSKGGTGAVERSQTAAQRASVDVAALLNSGRDPSSLVWLTAQIERQAGRLAVYRGNAASGAERDRNYAEAVGRFDCAVDALIGRAPDEQACAVQLRPSVRTRFIAAAAQISGPIVAETQIERASIRARMGAPEQSVLADYDLGINSLLSVGRAGTSPPAGLEGYLDLLVSVSAKGSDSAPDAFFKAVQAVGEPAIARQMSQLKSVVSASSDAGAKLRAQAELQRDVQGLRYQIADETDAAKKAALEEEQKTKEASLLALRDQIASSGKLRQIDDQPATIAEIRAALIPGEAYFKLTEVRARLYGIVVDKDHATIYAVTTPQRTTEAITRKVRLSIRDGSDKVPFFDVASAYALFRLVTGPAQDQLLAAKVIAVDPAGPLSALPAGVLVTDRASVTAYAQVRKSDPNDYSKVAFLAGRADISTALSPRSFLTARALAPSKAANPFIGFGQHAAATAPSGADTMIQVGLGCPISRVELARISELNEPISAEKIAVAANALGVPNAPRMTGKAFTDTGVEQRTDLDSFQVLHFATHGLPERKLGCTTIPPSLVTTLGGPGSDGFLSFGEVAGLRLDANLVVLSACQTSASASGASARAAGQEESGRSLDGLVRAFLAANARAVLATYWEVSIGSESDELVKTFYSHGRSESIGSALRDAQLDLMRQPRYSQPYYWGAYFVVGDASKSMLSKPATMAAK